MKLFPNKNILLSILAFTAFVVLLSACKNDDCEEVLCDPCESPKFTFQYLDSIGNCLSNIHQMTTITAYNDSALTDTAFSYSFSDSCSAGFLIDTDLRYTIIGPGINDVVEIVDFTYQEPLSITECCLCHPLEELDIIVNDSTMHVHFPVGSFLSEPVIMRVN